MYDHKKKLCLEQIISIGSFHNFHNVSMYLKWPQKLVTEKQNITR